MRRLDDYGSSVPLLTVLFVLLLAGLLIGVLALCLAPLLDTSNNINMLMNYLWVIGVPIGCLIGLFVYAVVKAQRSY